MANGNEIERKYAVRSIPSLEGKQPLRYECYILLHDGNTEARITRKGEKCVYEEKRRVSALERTREVREITANEFAQLQQQSIGGTVRDTYLLVEHPRTTLCIYHGRHTGLVRAEVEFANITEADAYMPAGWMGNEITGTPLANDATLAMLSDAEIAAELQKLHH